MSLPTEDKYFETKGDMFNQIVHLLGGRCAEALTLDDISTGASNDIQRATDIARSMVTKYGFSEKLGPVNYSSSDEVFLGKDFSTRQNYSEETANEIDEEIKAIIEEAYDAATAILEEHMEQLTAVAEGLLAVETLDREQFIQLFNGEKTPQELNEDLKGKMEEIAEKNKQEAREAKKIRRQKEREEREAAERKKLEDLEASIEEQGRNARFKPKVMTYDDVTMTPKPLKRVKPKAEEPEDPEEPEELEDEILEDEEVLDEEVLEDEELPEEIPDAEIEPAEEESAEEEPEEDTEGNDRK